MFYFEKIDRDGRSTMPARHFGPKESERKPTHLQLVPSGSTSTAEKARDIPTSSRRLRTSSYFVLLLVCLTLYLSILVLGCIAIGRLIDSLLPTSGEPAHQVSRPQPSSKD